MIKQCWKLYPYSFEPFIGTVYAGFVAFVPHSCPTHNALSQQLKDWVQLVFPELTKVVVGIYLTG